MFLLSSFREERTLEDNFALLFFISAVKTAAVHDWSTDREGFAFSFLIMAMNVIVLWIPLSWFFSRKLVLDLAKNTAHSKQFLFFKCPNKFASPSA